MTRRYTWAMLLGPVAAAVTALAANRDQVTAPDGLGRGS